MVDINSIIAKATEIGHDEVPIGGGNNSEVVEVLTAIFNEPSNKGKFFKSTELTKVLVNNDVPVTKIGNTLFAMKNQKLCSQVKKGVYTSYDVKYDGNITASASKDSEE